MERTVSTPNTGTMPVDGVVLAAGRSRRMGRPKALLAAGGGLFIERAIGALRQGGCREVVAVVRTADGGAAGWAEAAGARVVVNDLPEAEQIDSIRIGLKHLRPDAAAAAILPVDQPLVRAETVAAVLAAYRAMRAPVVRPVYRGEPGHPTVFDRGVFAELDDPALAEGARSVVRSHAGKVMDVDVDDAGILADIDTPADYRRYVELR